MRTRSCLIAILSALLALASTDAVAKKEQANGTVELERLGNRRDQKRFRETGHPNEQAVATGEEGDEKLLDDIILTDNALGNFGFDLEQVIQLC